MNFCPSHPLKPNFDLYFSLIPIAAVECLKIGLKPFLILRNRNELTQIFHRGIKVLTPSPILRVCIMGSCP